MMGTMPPEMMKMAESIMGQAATLAKSNVKLKWRIKQFSDFAEIEAFLNDGKNIVKINTIAWGSGIAIIYAVSE